MKNKLVATLLTASALGTSLLAAAPANANTFTANIRSRNEATNFNIQDFKDFIGKENHTLKPAKIRAQEVNLNQLILKHDHNVKVHFLGETAGGYRNRLDFKATDSNGQVTEGKIFGDTSCSYAEKGTLKNYSTFCQNPNHTHQNVANGDRNNSPLNVGDWVELGNFAAGTMFDFLLHSNDINGGIKGIHYETNTEAKGIFGLDKSKNPDGVQHVMGYIFKNFLVLRYEDLWGGGNKDYNDTVFAIDIGHQNAEFHSPAKVPEPSAAVALLATGAIGYLQSRRRSHKKA